MYQVCNNSKPSLVYSVWQKLFLGFPTYDQLVNGDNFIDFIFDMKISVPKQ